MLINEIRGWQLSQLDKYISILTNVVTEISDKDIRILRDGEEGWTILEILCHLRDFEEVFLERAQITVQQDNPVLPFPDPDILVFEKNYNEDDPKTVLDDWTKLRQERHAFLSTCADETWERPAKHPTRGNFTLHDQLFLSVWHDTNHLEQMLRILTQR